MSLPTNTRWTDRLAFDIALALEGSGENATEVLTRHGLPVEDLLQFNADPTFLKKVGYYREEIREKGMTFKLKARAQAEELLTTSWLLIHDPGVSPAVKADLIKSTVRWGGLENKDGVDTSEGGGVSITINLSGTEPQPKVIEHNARD